MSVAEKSSDIKCLKCEQMCSDDTVTVTCARCNSLYHQTCVVINENIDVWKCIICPDDEANQLKVPNAPKSHRSRSVFTSESSNSAMAEALKLFDEQEQILKKQAKERQDLLHEKETSMRESHELQNSLMKEKLSFLKQVAVSEAKSRASSRASCRSMTSQQKVVNWMKSQSNNVNSEFIKPGDGVETSKAVNFEETVVKEVASKIESPFTQITSQQLVASLDEVLRTHLSQYLSTDTYVVPPPIGNSTAMPKIPTPIVQNPVVPRRLTQVIAEDHPRSDRLVNSQPLEERVSKSSEPNATTLTREQIAARHVVKELPVFDGTPNKWPIFINAYRRTTRLCGFSLAENLERLNISLRGSAREAVKGSLTIEDNVPGIISTLELLFGRAEFIISDLLDNIRKDPRPKSENVESIIKFAFQVENVTNTMKGAHLNGHLWNPDLLREMIGRLPAILKNDWVEFAPNEPSLEQFSLWLSDKARKLSSTLTSAPTFLNSDNQQRKGFLNVHSAKSCVVCQDNCTALSSCKKFLNMSLSEKWSSLFEHKLCRTCLKSHPNKKWCNLDKICGVDGCTKRHNELLHRNGSLTKEDNNEDNKDEETLLVHVNHNRTLYKILPVILYGERARVHTYAMLDDGSSLTLLEETLVNELGLNGPSENLCLRWTGEMQRVEEDSKRVTFYISSPQQNSPRAKMIARSVKDLNLPSQSINLDELTYRYEHLEGLPLSSFENAQPRLLIGMDHARTIMMTQHKYGDEDEPIAGKCKLGWVLFGSGKPKESSVLHINKCDCPTNLSTDLDEVMKFHYSLESIGISAPNKLPTSSADQRALEILQSTTSLLDKRYEVGLLWKFDNVDLPASFTMAVRRLKCLEKQCERKPGLSKVIDETLSEYLQKGYIRKATADDMNEQQKWFLPIFVVQNPNKPGKVRLVWDAAATVNNVSLNSVLLKGMDQLTSLPGILQRFRERKIGVTGDIKEMYHQVKVRQEDQKFQMFLWRPNPNTPPVVYVMQVMTFGATCSPACAQYIKNINADRFKDEYPTAVECIKSNHYVDDMLDSVDSSREAVKLCEDVSYIHQMGGFHIRNWTTNSRKLHQSFQEVSSTSNKLEIKDESITNKVLGLWWNTEKDCFCFTLQFNKANVEILRGDRIPTKREVLRLLMSIFDPLGFLVHRLVFAKILMQQVWRSNVNWDDQIPNKLHDSWIQWVTSLEEIEKMEVPRWIGMSKEVEFMELHTFCDASEDAYGVVVYIRLILGDGSIKCSLIGAKSRVAPLKMLSIPRMELQGAVLGCRFANFILKELRITVPTRYYWSDSQTVLNWLHSEHKRYKQFVACRIGELLEATTVKEWRWIPTKNNVADLTTKMRLPSQVQQEEWINGPRFLYMTKENWPRTVINSNPEEELRSHHCLHIHHEESIIQPDNYSSWRRLLRVQAFILRYVHNLQRKIRSLPLSLGPLTREEHVSAQLYLFKQAQGESYSEELAVLLNGASQVDKRSSIFKEVPYVDDKGIIRAKTRIGDNIDLDGEFKRPIILPRKHRITQLLLGYYHSVVFRHQSHETVVNEIRQKYVVPKLRRELGSIRFNCQHCKNVRAQPEIPIESDLPAARITMSSRPFTFIGIDYFGPMIVVTGRRREKRWGVVITCLTTRAVHLEMAYSLSSDSCIIALRNHINRRGKPRTIYSDNGTNFRGASRELAEAALKIDNSVLAEHFTDAETEWSFIPPSSPHMGGAWERMVRSVKNALDAILKNITPRDEILHSALIEAENIINSRPLTYIPIESENDEALTPNHFLLGSSNGVKPLSSHEKYLNRSDWKKIQHIADLFWKRWSAEYLPTIIRRTKWFSCSKSLKLGDIVKICGEPIRNSWPKGRVVELHPSRDGKVRSATIQTTQGLYKRPVAKLAILDVLSREIGTTSNIDEIPGGNVANVSKTVEILTSQPMNLTGTSHPDRTEKSLEQPPMKPEENN